MSTYWFYRIRARLRPELRDLDIEGVRAVARDRFGVSLPAEQCRWLGVEAPVLGPDLVYDGSRFSEIQGAAVEDGEIKVATFQANLEREPFEDEDGITEGANGSRLDLLLRFLTWATEGVPGEVVGCLTCEHDPRHADPLVRCADGRVRVASSEPIPYNYGDWFSGPDEDIPVPAVLPCEFLRIEDDTHADLDCEGLRRRYRVLEGSLTPPLVDRPSGA